MTITRDLVAWAWDLRHDAIPPEVRRRAAVLALDGIGNALAAAHLGTVPFAEPVARALGLGGDSTVLGSTGRLPATGAALANGILVHGLDFDDTHTAGLVHATAVTLPSALAVAQREDATGADLVRALVVGYELVGRLGRVAPHGFHAKGFHATSVCGTFTAALVTALLSGLDPEQAVHALGIAGSQSSGSMEFLATGASTKQIHPGWASLAGIVAAGLAAAGATGPDSILEGERGLYVLHSAVPADLGALTADLGSTWQVHDVEVKPYPACHLLHRSLDVAQALHATVDPADVTEVVVRVAADSVPIVAAPAATKQRPRSAYEAKFSVQWSVAAMLVDGEVGVETYRSDRIDRPEVRTLAERVRYEPVTDDVPAAEQPGDIEVVLSGGRTTRLRSTDPGVQRPGGTEETVMGKFATNTAGAPGTERLAAAVLGLDDAPDLAELTAALDAQAGARQLEHSA